jgi:hypothetical protein
MRSIRNFPRVNKNAMGWTLVLWALTLMWSGTK